jgi:phosphohistidine phosphatase
MDLYLVRHGEAMIESADPVRPLSARGREEVDRLAAHLRNEGVTVAEIRHSGKARAAQTAERIANAIGAPTSAVAGLQPDDDPMPMAEVVSLEIRDLMLVGHLPHLALLAQLLLASGGVRSSIELRTAGLLRLRREAGSWRLIWALTSDALGRQGTG